jgi:hypothetical protein
MRGKWHWEALKVWVLAGCMMVGGLAAAHGATYDATGTWTYTTSGNWVNAGSAECSADSSDTVTITIDQSGNSVDVVIKGQTYSGTVSGATYTGTASYAEDGGTTTVTVRFTLTSNSAGSGTFEWSWSDGMYSCNGGADISLSKNGASTPYDATGTWTYTASGNWVSSGGAECSADSDDTVSITIDQSGDSVDVVIKGRTYSGTVSDTTYTGTASYAEDGGTTTVTVRFTLTSNSTGTGTVGWSWSDGYESCDGGSNIALRKSDSGDGSGDSGGGSSDSGGGGSDDDGGGSGCFIKSLAGI